MSTSSPARALWIPSLPHKDPCHDRVRQPATPGSPQSGTPAAPPASPSFGLAAPPEGPIAGRASDFDVPVGPIAAAALRAPTTSTTAATSTTAVAAGALPGGPPGSTQAAALHVAMCREVTEIDEDAAAAAAAAGEAFQEDESLIHGGHAVLARRLPPRKVTEPGKTTLPPTPPQHQQLAVGTADGGGGRGGGGSGGARSFTGRVYGMVYDALRGYKTLGVNDVDGGGGAGAEGGGAAAGGSEISVSEGGTPHRVGGEVADDVLARRRDVRRESPYVASTASGERQREVPSAGGLPSPALAAAVGGERAGGPLPDAALSGTYNWFGMYDDVPLLRPAAAAATASQANVSDGMVTGGGRWIVPFASGHQLRMWGSLGRGGARRRRAWGPPREAAAARLALLLLGAAGVAGWWTAQCLRHRERAAWAVLWGLATAAAASVGAYLALAAATAEDGNSAFQSPESAVAGNGGGVSSRNGESERTPLLLNV